MTHFSFIPRHGGYKIGGKWAHLKKNGTATKPNDLHGVIRDTNKEKIQDLIDHGDLPRQGFTE